MLSKAQVLFLKDKYIEMIDPNITPSVCIFTQVCGAFFCCISGDRSHVHFRNRKLQRGGWDIVCIFDMWLQTCHCAVCEHTQMASSSYTRQTTLHLVTTKFIWWCTAYIIINKQLKILTHITPVSSVCCGRELPADEESFLLSQWSPDDNTVSVLRITYCFAHVTNKCDIKS